MQADVKVVTKKISVIVPCYNISGYIERCLDSISKQTYENFECIIIDDGSTDDTFAVAKNYTMKDDRFKVERQTNSGVSAARNRGLALADGDCIYFLDGDDWIEPDLLRRAADYLKKGFRFVSFGYDEQSVSGEVVRIFADKGSAVLLSSEVFLSSIFKKKVRQHLCSFVLDRSILTGNGLRFSETMFYGEDQEFQIKAIVYAGQVVYDPICMYHYCYRRNSAVNRSANIRKLDSLKMYPELRMFLLQESMPRSIMTSYDNFVSMQFFGLLKDGYRTQAESEYFTELSRYEYFLNKVTLGWSKFEILNVLLSKIYFCCPRILNIFLNWMKRIKLA